MAANIVTMKKIIQQLRLEASINRVKVQFEAAPVGCRKFLVFVCV